MKEDGLHEQITALYGRLGANTRERWDRDLPFDELLFDRWERARRLGFGVDSSVYQASYIYGDVRVGSRTWVGPYTLLDGSGGIEIGENCSISAGVQIYSHDTVQWALTNGVAEAEHAPVRIGDCCFIGSQSVIVRGVTIGDHCVVGACSFVDRDLPSFTVAAGVPCRPIGRVELKGGSAELVFDVQSGNQPDGPSQA